MKRLLATTLLLASPATAQTSPQSVLAPDVWTSLQFCQVDQLYHFVGKCPSGWLPSPSLSGLPPIIAIGTAGLSVSTEITKSAAPDVVGAFRFICNAGQIRPDDPIVYPGQPGKSHLHQFYGNDKADANSTYQSLRTTGNSTCMTPYPFNRSAYWMPAMLDGLGNVVRPDFVSIYYKRRPLSDPVVSDPTNAKYMGKAVPLPNGLKFIFGYDMLTGKAPTGNMWFNCQNGGGTGAIGGTYKTLAEVASKCPVGTQVGVVIEAPNCWDGKNLDSPNHRDHMAYADYGTWGYKKCDAAHPYVIPGFTLGAWYRVTSSLTTWSASSDAMFPNLPKGTTFHADFWMAWEPQVHDMWEANCINKMLNCSAGNLGNGFRLPGAELRKDPGPMLVPLSSLGAQ